MLFGKKKKTPLKVKVSFDPRIPLSFTAYVDNTRESRLFLAAVRRVANQFNIEVKVKPLSLDSPTVLPALFVQDKYFFSYRDGFSEKALRSFVIQARAKQKELMEEWVRRNQGRPVVAPRPLYDTDGRKYPDRFRLLMPSQYDLGYQRYTTDDIGWEVNQFTVEGLHQLGVDVLMFPDAGTGDFVIYTGVRPREE